MIKTTLIALAIAASLGTARADVYSVTTPISGYNLDGSGINFNAAYFDTTRGTLRAVNLTFAGQLTLYVEGGYTNPPPTFDFQTHNYFLVNGDGVSQSSVLANGTGYGNFAEMHGNPLSFSITDAVSQAQVADYATPGSGLQGWVGPTSTIFGIPAGVGAEGGTPSGGDYFSGVLTETFAYSPGDPPGRHHHTDVPEPGSLALLGTGLLGLLGVRLKNGAGARLW